MKAFIFLFLGIFVFPSMLKLQGSWKSFVDLFAIILSLSSLIYGIYLLF